MIKKDIRTQLHNDLEQFLKSGGKITECKTIKNPKAKLTASGSQKPFFSWSEPKNRPSNNWDGIITVD